MKKIVIPRKYPIIGKTGDTTLRSLVYEYATLKNLRFEIENSYSPLEGEGQDENKGLFYGLKYKLLNEVDIVLQPVIDKIIKILNDEFKERLPQEIISKYWWRGNFPPGGFHIQIVEWEEFGSKSKNFDFGNSVIVKMFGKISLNEEILVEYEFQDGYSSSNYIYESKYQAEQRDYYYDENGDIRYLSHDLYATLENGQIKIHRYSEPSEEELEHDDYYERESYGRYSGTYAQDEAGLSDNFIDDVLDGNPDAYWNID